VNLPSAFTQNIENTFGERGRLFLRALPTLLEEAAQRWQLTDLQRAEHLSYNYITFARRGEAQVVLKLGVPDRELTSEIRSLRHFAGRGAVRLLESDSGRGMLLLERVTPGESLAALADDAQATHIAAELMLALRRPIPSEAGLIQLADWFLGLQRFRERFDGGTGPLDRGLFGKAESVARDLLHENQLPALIHGDLHHFNILSSGGNWLAIDPKGVLGPAAYEVGPFILNPWMVTGIPPDAPRLMSARIAMLAEVLQLEQERIRNWGFAHAVLSAVWSLDANADWRPAMECAQILSAQRT